MRQTVGALLVTVLVTVALLALNAPLQESNGGLRIMPLGDSITEGGQGFYGGYRVELWRKLVDSGYKVDFVGSGSNGPPELGDHDHEGHAGWRIDQLDARAADAVRTYDPQVVLLHIGTNDLDQNFDVPNAPARLSILIDHILAAKPSVVLVVAQIIPQSLPDWEAAVRTYNAALPAIVASKGPQVHLVDMHSAVAVADLPDGIHPNWTGNAKMAAVWFDALRGLPLWQR